MNVWDAWLAAPSAIVVADDDPNKFIAKMGAEAIASLLEKLDLDELSYHLRDKASNETSQQRKTEALKRLQVVESMRDGQGHTEYHHLYIFYYYSIY